jgi:hypothetical protein
LHHPHTAVKRMTWQHAWNGLRREVISVQSYLGTGCYTYRDSKNGFSRDSIGSVLVATGTQSDPGVVDVVVRRGL